MQELVQVVAVALLEALKRHDHYCEVRQCTFVAVIIDSLKLCHQFRVADVVGRTRFSMSGCEQGKLGIEESLHGSSQLVLHFEHFGVVGGFPPGL